MSADGPGPECNWTDFTSLSFRLYYYKVLPCTKPFSHDWQHCPFTHPNDKARRRSPLQYPYAADMCPAMLQSGKCPKGVNCNLAHNLFEYHLHPDRYKTKMCRDGAKCRRVFCFFAHTPAELRVPFLATTAAAAAAAQQQVGGSNGSSSSTSVNTSVNQPATPGSSPGKGHALDTVAQHLAAALDSASMGGSSTNSAEMILGARSGSGSVGPAARQAFDASPIHQVRGHHAPSSSTRCPMPGSSNSSSSSRLSHVQQYNGFVAGAGQQQLQQQPGVFAGSACDAAAANQQQQGQACYSVWDYLPSDGMHCTAAARAGHVLGVDGSNAVFDTQNLLPLGATAQATDVVMSTSAGVITPLALRSPSSTLPWSVQAVNSAAVNFISTGTVNSGLKCLAPTAINMEMFASSMSDTHLVADSSSWAGAHHIRLLHPRGRPDSAPAAAAAAGAATTGALAQQQQQQQQPLQLFLQSDSTTTPHMLTQEVNSTSGQYNTVLLPVKLLAATSAAAGGAAVQYRTVLPAVPLSMPGQQQQQQQQTTVPHTVVAGSTAAAGATVLPMPQWLI